MQDMFFTLEQIKLRLSELSELRYRDRIKLGRLHFQSAGTGAPDVLDENEWERISIGHKWQGRDSYAWLNAIIEVPQSWDNHDILGLFDFGTTDYGTNSGFESLLLVDDKPFQGVDQNHKEVFLSDVVAPGEKKELIFMLWSGLEGGGIHRSQEHCIRDASLAWLDVGTDDLYYWFVTAIETIEALNENQSEQHSLLNLLEQSFLLLDWTEPGSPDFYQSVTKARDLFQNGLARFDKSGIPTVSGVGHAHIDVAWLWRLRHTREKAVRTFSTALRLMERYPEYVFLQSQPQLYEYIKEDQPEIFEQIKKQVARGQWEPEGVMWLESDCNIVSGESLVRQMLFGTSFFRTEFGIDCSCLWLPDVFGFSAALPQIMKQFGIDVFMTTKISWNQYNRLPNDTFHWRGLDGSEVLAHMITTPYKYDPIYTYNADTDPVSLIGLWNEYQQKRVNTDLLTCYGYGDGGGGPDREMIERLKRADKLPGLPRTRFEGAGKYFNRLKKTIENSDQKLPVWDDELYLEKHRGVYTSQAKTKKSNRKAELGLRRIEIFSMISVLLNNNWNLYDQASINDAWKILLRNQFHDIIPGSSIKEVYDDSQLEYETVFRGLSEIQETLFPPAVAEPDTFTVFNTGSSPTSELISICGRENVHGWQGDQGKPLESVRTEDGWLISIKDLPAMGWTGIKPATESSAPKEPEPNPFLFKDRTLDTPYYTVLWNRTGQMTRIYDKENQKDVLSDDCCANEFQIFDDRPMNNKDAWGMELYYQGKHNSVNEIQCFTHSFDGDLRCTVSTKWRYSSSIIEQDVRFYRDSRRIDFETRINWQETRKLLKVAFPVDIRAREARYDIQFGNISRPTHWNTSWDMAKFEVCAHQWADLSQKDYGVSLLNDCKYGYDIHNNVIRLSLLKSPVYPDTEGDKGTHEFTYSLYPHAGDWDAGRTIQVASQLNDPLTVVPGSLTQETGSIINLKGNGLIIDALKKAEESESLLLRLHESRGAGSLAEISSPLKIDNWREVDMREEPIGKEHRDELISLSFKPYEIKTLLINISSRNIE